jgi:hypothetical protein
MSHDACDKVIRDPRVAFVNFTGSVSGGHSVQKSASERFIGMRACGRTAKETKLNAVLLGSPPPPLTHTHTHTPLLRSDRPGAGRQGPCLCASRLQPGLHGGAAGGWLVLQLWPVLLRHRAYLRARGCIRRLRRQVCQAHQGTRRCAAGGRARVQGGADARTPCRSTAWAIPSSPPPTSARWSNRRPPKPSAPRSPRPVCEGASAARDAAHHRALTGTCPLLLSG